jgi:nicotinamide mononucleotide transporter
MSLDEFYSLLKQGINNFSWQELVAVVAGIASVMFSRVENILVYPVGLVSTTLYIYLSYKYQLLGEAVVNLYYTYMSIYGWILWARRNDQHQPVVRVTWSSRKEWRQQLVFFGIFFVSFFIALTFARNSFYEGAIPFGDSFATATAFTGMWLMAKKKVESWYWWIATNFASIPLYFVKHLVLTSVFYGILLVMAIFGLAEWKRRARKYSKEAHALNTL